jgi:hypothetical protein
MSVKSGRLPSPGFVAVVATYLAVVLFFVWGLGTPPLQRVWEIHHLMKIGELYRLNEGDRALLEEAMREREELARDLLDGHELGIVSEHLDGWITTPFATLLRTGDSGAIDELVIDVQTDDDRLPLGVVVRGATWEVEREAAERGRVVVPIPPPENGPEIVEVELGGERDFADASVIGVRVSWEVRP